MERYYLNHETNTNPNGNHEVHKASCDRLPLRNGTDLGLHPDCKSAIRKAKTYYSNVDGCKRCSEECHSEQSL